MNYVLMTVQQLRLLDTAELKELQLQIEEEVESLEYSRDHDMIVEYSEMYITVCAEIKAYNHYLEDIGELLEKRGNPFE